MQRHRRAVGKMAVADPFDGSAPVVTRSPCDAHRPIGEGVPGHGEDRGHVLRAIVHRILVGATGSEEGHPVGVGGARSHRQRVDRTGGPLVPGHRAVCHGTIGSVARTTTGPLSRGIVERCWCGRSTLHDEAAFDAWYEVLRYTDDERWPDHPGWDRRTVKAMADLRNGATDFLCLAATDATGTTVGIGMLQVPQWDNRHLVMLDVRVLPDHRRRHVGATIAAEAERWATGAGRTVIQCEAEVPVAATTSDASTSVRPAPWVCGGAEGQSSSSLPTDRRTEVATAAG